MYNLKSQKSFLGMKSFWDFLRLHMNTPFNMHSWFWCKLNISGYVCIHVNSVKVTAPTITNVYKITEEVLPQFIITYKYKILSLHLIINRRYCIYKNFLICQPIFSASDFRCSFYIYLFTVSDNCWNSCDANNSWLTTITWH